MCQDFNTSPDGVNWKVPNIWHQRVSADWQVKRCMNPRQGLWCLGAGCDLAVAADPPVEDNDPHSRPVGHWWIALMSLTFNPYHKWLGIPLEDQPPNHYRLLGITLFEADNDVIEAAAERQIAHVQRFKSGEHAALARDLLNELSA